MHDIKVLNNKCKMGGGDVGSQWFVRRRTRSLVGLKPTNHVKIRDQLAGFFCCCCCFFFTDSKTSLTARTARFSQKSLGSDVGEIKKMSEKLKKKSVLSPRKIEHGDLL